MKALPLKGSTSHVRTNKREQINADLECQKSLPNQVKALHNRLMEKLTLVTGPSGAGSRNFYSSKIRFYLLVMTFE
jgi:hypothetical protein